MAIDRINEAVRREEERAEAQRVSLEIRDGLIFALDTPIGQERPGKPRRKFLGVVFGGKSAQRIMVGTTQDKNGQALDVEVRGIYTKGSVSPSTSEEPSLVTISHPHRENKFYIISDIGCSLWEPYARREVRDYLDSLNGDHEYVNARSLSYEVSLAEVVGLRDKSVSPFLESLGLPPLPSTPPQPDQSFRADRV